MHHYLFTLSVLIALIFIAFEQYGNFFSCLLHGKKNNFQYFNGLYQAVAVRQIKNVHINSQMETQLINWAPKLPKERDWAEPQYLGISYMGLQRWVLRMLQHPLLVRSGIKAYISTVPSHNLFYNLNWTWWGALWKNRSFRLFIATESSCNAYFPPVNSCKIELKSV